MSKLFELPSHKEQKHNGKLDKV